MPEEKLLFTFLEEEPYKTIYNSMFNILSTNGLKILLISLANKGDYKKFLITILESCNARKICCTTSSASDLLFYMYPIFHEKILDSHSPEFSKKLLNSTYYKIQKKRLATIRKNYPVDSLLYNRELFFLDDLAEVIKLPDLNDYFRVLNWSARMVATQKLSFVEMLNNIELFSVNVIKKCGNNKILSPNETETLLLMKKMC